MRISSRDSRPRHSGLIHWLNLFAGLILIIGLAACGGGGETDTASEQNTGQVVLSLTDAEGDFLTYSVDVLSIQMTHANGRTVETLPLTTRVDFAQYTQLTEFLTTATVPQGRYTEALVTLDYSTAQIEVEGPNGEAVPVTEILDSNGQPVTTLTMRVQLDRTVPIAAGLIRYILFDFDLAQSHTVDINAGQASIVVEPVLIATVERESPKHHRLRGPLKSVNVADGYYELYIRPYFRRILRDTDNYGEFRVYIADDTHFEIDGIPYTGSAGLSVLETLPEYTAVVAVGRVRMNPVRFEADEVYAGSSVPGGDMDVVKGSVVARSGDVITVKGATLVRSDGSVVFNDQVEVTLADSTVVTKQFSTETHTIDDISVGQRIVVFGTVIDGVDGPSFSAESGYARMELSQVRGLVTAVPDVSNDFLILNLTAINGRNPAIYDFSGTQAAADQYEVDTATLPLDTITPSEDVEVRGFPVGFGDGPVDYTAQSVIEKSSGTE